MDSTSLERGRAIYNARCYFCHGYSGDARTVASKYLDPVPRDFTKSPDLTGERIERAVRHGRARTAMQPFTSILDDTEIESVTAFVLEALVRCATPNIRYHTAENGWPDHERRNGAAFPFVLGTLAVNAREIELSAAQRSGLNLFRRACGVCHEGTIQGTVLRQIPESPSAPDVAPSQNPNLGHEGHSEHEEYGRGYGNEEEIQHDRIPVLADLTPLQHTGRNIYQQSCALCHAADGTGRNWIGTFLDPSPPSFIDTAVSARLDDDYLKQVTLGGLPNTSMPAFRSVLEIEQIDAIVAYMRRAFLDRPQ